MLIPDWTLLPQLALFFTAVVILNLLLFRPVGRVLAERKEGTVEASSEADDLRAEAGRLEADYQGKIRTAREQALAARAELRAAGQSEAAQGLASGRQEAEQIAAKAARELAGELDRAQGEMRAQAEGLSAAIVGRLLGRKN